jgi:hypothetical protein
MVENAMVAYVQAQGGPKALGGFQLQAAIPKRF